MIEFLFFMVIGIGILMVGVFTFMGNIKLIHSYHWKKVSEENKGVYCRFMGVATIILGICLIATSILEIVGVSNISWIVALAGAVICIGIIIYAQFKYNKGIF